MDVLTTLYRIHEILGEHSEEGAVWIGSVITLSGRDEARFYRELNSARMWGGAGSIANQALADNPGMDERIWQAGIREFRELMIELGSHLQARGTENPDISSWMLAFSNWNQSEV
ncbi:MAG: hypothetical protein U9P00_13210 [Pseudomonadota bacterium]|nr:hypothetical protein [Pseudomonadota bacterium]